VRSVSISNAVTESSLKEGQISTQAVGLEDRGLVAVVGVGGEDLARELLEEAIEGNLAHGRLGSVLRC
jgi:hypothetical protein